MTVLRALTHRAAITAALLTTAILVPASAAEAADGAPPEGAGIVRITASGTGCAPGSVTTNWADATGFSVYYADLVVRAGAGAPVTDARKACLLSVQLDIPFGYRVALQSASARRYSALATGARVTARGLAYWQAKPETVSWAEYRRGPGEDHWQSEHLIEPAAQQFSVCGQNRLLNINQELFIARGPDPSIESSAEFDREAGVNAAYRLVWQRCLF